VQRGGGVAKCLWTRLVAERFGDGGDVLPGLFRDRGGVAFYEIGADADREGAGFDEIRGGGEIHAARGKQFDLGQWSFDGLEVGRASDGIRGEDLHGIGAGSVDGGWLSR